MPGFCLACLRAIITKIFEAKPKTPGIVESCSYSLSFNVFHRLGSTVPATMQYRK
ncbi:hypothetical protein PT7_0038 [Pusillimonas sp. T7-7]|nr:hypothetical protein PT7_0038 [Pusillimonas sp. T7-7]